MRCPSSAGRQPGADTRRLLEAARTEAARLGRDRLYLITDHDAFYERCGWEHLGFAHEESGIEVRLYGIDTARLSAQ